MGVDLTIMPLSYRFEDRVSCQDIIMLERDRGLWEAIEEAGEEIDVSVPVFCHLAQNERGETCYGVVTENPYGNATQTID